MRRIVFLFLLMSIFGYQFIVTECMFCSAAESQEDLTVESEGGTVIHTNYDFEDTSIYEQSAVENDAGKSTGIIDEDVEEALNYAGVTDEDICQYDAETIEKCNTKKDIYVSVEYYEETKKGQDLKTLSNTEKEEYYRKYCEENGIAKIEKKSVLSYFKQFFSPIKAKANTRDTDKDKSKDGKFRHTLLMFSQKVDGKKGIYFCYTAQWLEEPYYRSIDLITVAVDNGTIVKTNQYPLKANCSYTFVHENYSILGHSESRTKFKNNISYAWQYIGADSAVAYVEDLPGHGGLPEAQARELAKKNYGSFCRYEDITYAIYGYATKSSSAVKKMCVNAYYKHEKSTVKVTPSISFNGTSVDFGLSASVENKYVRMATSLSVSVNQYK